jgi:hypothetical protein
MTSLITSPIESANISRHAETEKPAADPMWKSLYTLGGAASLLMVLIVPMQSVVFMIAPPQTTAADWFTLFEKSALLGLLGFELLMIVYVIASIPLALALTMALRSASQSLMAVYLAFSLLGVALFVAARPAFEMLTLSQHFTAATNQAERAVYLAAGESKLATFEGTAFQVSYIMGSISGLLLSIVMLRSRLFSKATAYTRILSSVLDFGIFIPVIGLAISLFSVVFLWVFHILAARRLFQLRHLSDKTLAPTS